MVFVIQRHLGFPGYVFIIVIAGSISVALLLGRRDHLQITVLRQNQFLYGN